VLSVAALMFKLLLLALPVLALVWLIKHVAGRERREVA